MQFGWSLCCCTEPKIQFGAFQHLRSLGLEGNGSNCAVLLPYLHDHSIALPSTASSSSSSSQGKSRSTSVPPSSSLGTSILLLSLGLLLLHALLPPSLPISCPPPTLQRVPFLPCPLFSPLICGLRSSRLSQFLKSYQVPQPLKLLPSPDLNCPKNLESSPCSSPCRSPLLQKAKVLLYHYSQCFQCY